MTRFILRFYFPILTGVVLIALVLFSPQVVSTDSRVELEMGVSVGVLGIKVPLETWLQNAWVLQFMTVVSALSCFIYSINIDFSQYFPTRLRMDVYFDKTGLSRTLRSFSLAELGDVRPPDDWQQRIAGYDASVLNGLMTLWNSRKTEHTPFIHDMSRESLHAQGETKICISKQGWLLYKVAEGSGTLHVGLDIPSRGTFRFRSEFYLRETGVNYIRPWPLDLIRSPTVVLRPEFKQVFQIEQGGPDAPFDHVVIGLTKLRLLPTPTFSDTIYLWRDPTGESVPVAYAIYSSIGDKPETRSTAF
jgi:hypothetical protein